MGDYIVDLPSEEALAAANEDIKVRLNALCSDFNDILSNVSTLEYDATLLAGIEEASSIDVSSLKTQVDSISKYLSSGVLYLFGVMPKFEEVVKKINLGEPYDKGMFESTIEWTDFADWGMDTLDEIFKDNKTWGAIGFLLNYAINDPAEQTVDNIFSDDNSERAADMIWGIIKGHIKKSGLANSATPLWINAPVGGIVASFGVALIDLINDEGAWTGLDTDRLLWDMASAFGNTVTSTLVAAGVSALCTKIGGTIGSAAGPIGAFIGAVAGWGVGLLIDWLGAEAVGDTQLDKYIVVWHEDGTSEVYTWTERLEEVYKNGTDTYRVYEVPKNGNGKNGTFDVMVERFSGYKKYQTPDGQSYTEKNYKDMMYTSFRNNNNAYGISWDEFTRMFNFPHRWDTESYPEAMNKIMNEMLEEGKEEFDWNEFYDKYYQWWYGHPGEPLRPNEYPMPLSPVMTTDIGFDFEEYYEFLKNNKEKLDTYEGNQTVQTPTTEPQHYEWWNYPVPPLPGS